MTPDEQRMIQDLFQRLQSQGRVAKDHQADRVIADAVRSNPDAAYMLVQTTLVYEHQMEEQEQRIRDLEDQIAQLQTRSAPPAASSGSFLGGRIGSARGGSVPSVSMNQGSPWQSAPQAPMQQAEQAPRRGGMFGGAAPSQAPMQQQPPAGGGGFLRSALTTAAGVAGGMMVANSLSGLFGGNSAQAAGSNDAALSDADAQQDALQDAQYEADTQQYVAQDASYDSGGGWDDSDV